MSVKIEPLGSLCDVRIGRTPRRDSPQFWGGSAIWVTVGELNGGAITESAEHITDLAVSEVMPEPVPAGTLLFSFKLSIGKMAVAGVPLYTNEAIAALVIRRPDQLDRDYLRFSLLAGGTEAGANHAVLGKVLNKAKVQALPIPVRPISEQRRIVDLLSRAEGIVRLRREAQKKAAEIIPALFLDMFGDPATNPKEWPAVKVGDLVHAAQDGPHVSPAYADTGVPFLSTRHIRPGQILFEDLKFLTKEEAERQWKKCKPQRGDVLYTKGGTTGVAAAIDFDTAIAVWVHVAVLKTDHSKVHSLWLESMLNSDFCYRQSQELTHGIANRDLGLKRMVKIAAYLPPKDEQQRFVELAMRFRAVQEQQVSGTAKAEATFNALLGRMFSVTASEDKAQVVSA